MTDTPLPPEVFDLRIPADRPLVVVDVDEVLGMFMRGFEAFVGGHGIEMRIDRFALFQNLYRPGETTHVDVSDGRRLFDAFFECDPQTMDVAPGAAEALAGLANHATIVDPDQRPGRLPARRAHAGWSRTACPTPWSSGPAQGTHGGRVGGPDAARRPPSSTISCRTSIRSPRRRRTSIASSRSPMNACDRSRPPRPTAIRASTAGPPWPRRSPRD